ncbi:putative Zn(II)2Cys6 transcription factor [Lipomyces chichibuensis]|uniref:putative Zn(II)2Cys6 transcription factor n=1 Tax=Lipomyces chichibuensis TaxID=1546026 RepID=UPI0033437A88
MERKLVRSRIACLRCQKRKIRCNGGMPCQCCQKAGVECVDNGKREVHRSSLQNRIHWLESIVRSRCPDIDLDQEPHVWRNDDIQDLPDDSTADEPISSSSNKTGPENPVLLESRSSPPGSRIAEQDRVGIESHQRDSRISENQSEPRLAHEIGLVSLSSATEPRYIGPSSGYFFAKLVLACAGRKEQQALGSSNIDGNGLLDAAAAIAKELSRSPLPLPVSLDTCIQLSSNYFETVHLCYPFLHQPSYLKLIEHLYSTADPDPDPFAAFQVNMVLAIATSDLSRRLKICHSGEGYFLNAMDSFGRCCAESSLNGLQCLLLLMVYAIHNPGTGLNIWYLNYQCIATSIDLGLQRDIKRTKNFRISHFEHEMRTRVFWTVYTLDRTLGTMMGRPIGLRDEACELRLPSDVADDLLTEPSIHERAKDEPPTHMSHSIQLFKLAQLNSEIKYVLHSICHEAPPYTYPQITDISQWQKDMVRRLNEWVSDVPQCTLSTQLGKLSQIRYHEMMVLLLRPSPAIRSPSKEITTLCYNSAVQCIRLISELYKQDLLCYSRFTVHSLILSTLTLLYCTWIIPDIVSQTRIDELITDLKASSNVLSAMGEYWLEAKRSRDSLDELSGAVVRLLSKSHSWSDASSHHNNPDEPAHTACDAANSKDNCHAISSLSGAVRENEDVGGPYTNTANSFFPLPTFNEEYLNADIQLLSAWFDEPTLAAISDWTVSTDIDDLIRDAPGRSRC